MTALITGASSGIGAAFARELAAAGHDLVLVARRRERLDALGAELSERHGIAVHIIVADLSTVDGIEKTVQAALLHDPDFLINNAGFGTIGRFVDVSEDKQLAMVHVHVTAPLRLCHAVVPLMLAARRGSIINVASIAAFLPMKGNANYAATKGWVVTFSQSLNQELRSHGIRVQALCPGYTRTEFHETPEYSSFETSAVPRMLWMTPEQIVSASLRALQRNREICVPGWKYRLLVPLLRSRAVISGLRRLRR